MNRQEIISSKILEIELQITLLDYLNVNDYIEDGMYKSIINKLINKLNSEKQNIDYNSNNYRLYEGV